MPADVVHDKKGFFPQNKSRFRNQYHNSSEIKVFVLKAFWDGEELKVFYFKVHCILYFQYFNSVLQIYLHLNLKKRKDLFSNSPNSCIFRRIKNQFISVKNP